MNLLIKLFSMGFFLFCLKSLVCFIHWKSWSWCHDYRPSWHVMWCIVKWYTWKTIYIIISYDFVNTRKCCFDKYCIYHLYLFMHMHIVVLRNIRYRIPTIKFSCMSFRYDARQLRRQLMEVIDQMGEASARVNY